MASSEAGGLATAKRARRGAADPTGSSSTLERLTRSKSRPPEMVFQSERVTCCGSKTNCGGGWSESTGHDLRMTELPMNPAAVLKALAEASPQPLGQRPVRETERETGAHAPRSPFLVPCLYVGAEWPLRILLLQGGQAAGLSQHLQCLLLQLADSLSGYAKLLPDFLQCPRPIVEESESQGQHEA